LAEVKRLWELEFVKEHIAIIQAAVLLNFTLNMDGMDKQYAHIYAGTNYSLTTLVNQRDAVNAASN
jgi:hypothetical protein